MKNDTDVHIESTYMMTGSSIGDLDTNALSVNYLDRWVKLEYELSEQDRTSTIIV